MPAYKLTLEVPATTELDEACNRAQLIADAAMLAVEFEFNGVDCVAVPGGDPYVLEQRQSAAQNTRPRVTNSEKEE